MVFSTWFKECQPARNNLSTIKKGTYKRYSVSLVQRMNLSVQPVVSKHFRNFVLLALCRGQTVDGQRVGASYHKYCCRSQPHCPREFFHGLGFPPSAEGVVKDWYNQEIGNYDVDTGRAFMNTEINHFSNIVWRNTTKIGCAQSKISSARCVFTLAVYLVEGSIGTPENFMKNIGRLSKILNRFIC